MEREYKWKLSGEAEFERILGTDAVSQAVIGGQDYHMQAIYYDTENHLFAKLQGGLRLRKENGASVCCLKLAAAAEGACKSREEYEVEAPDIYSGLTALIGAGAPKEVCMMAASSTLTELCRTDFKRRAYTLHIHTPSGTCEGELAFDFGKLARGDRSIPLCEMEFELKCGDLQPFHAFAHTLEKTFELAPQPLSKMARAMAL
ncbi:MAG: CYTH domain-containing protein [Butyricicoccaceae bacterium]